ncbi:Eco57I restriction-modification methylase domain-containing protein [Erythrobacter aureus]|uniref:site-specific DNA-methyltransferase (adenine-specific) n=1 Tax=Erythrobacter aureus TaxID=2182384 RepID=A0A345YII6_9SPHN|nr:N-6 DNA methylase [Erythrobacter aureus]AXK43738.1 SAM-dependent methyltransferase [Erythrobacter aureus]
MKPASALEFEFSGDPLAADIDKIHRGTAIYTAIPEIEALLDRLGWPDQGTRLLDPGAGNGGFLVAALARIDMKKDDVETAVHRIRGYEFHPSAAQSARRAVSDHLLSRGWTIPAADKAAVNIVEIRDFLLSPVPVGQFDIIAANPPYWRLANLPPESAYRFQFETQIPAHAKADLLYAYLNKAVDIVHPDGLIGLVTADRWLLNKGSADLRAKIGERYTVHDIQRLESKSAFYRPKTRRKGSPARVHPVSLVLSPGDSGRRLTAEPFMIEELPEIDGTPLADIATIRLAPWLGPDGIFIVFDKTGLPEERLIPCVEPENLCPQTDTITGFNRWALLTDKAEPEASVLDHLDNQLERMPNRGQREPRWLPPEPFAGKLPLSDDAVLVPRIAKNLRPILLPAGTMPVNHNLVVVAGIPAAQLIEMLKHPLVQRQADVLALRLENGYRSYTATLLRQLIIPREALPENIS